MIMRASTLVLPFFLPGVYSQLDTLAKAAGLKYFGTATDNPELTDTAYVAKLSNTSDFGQITPGNSQKWDAIEPSPGVFSYTQGDQITNLAEKNGQLLRCHNLCWYNQLPTWVTNGSWTNETLTAALQNHITNEVTHYKGQCYSWDVVNEAFEDNGTFRHDVFFNVIGEDYIRIAFEAAASADPEVKLYYNDYNIEQPGVKTTSALNLIKSLKTAGVKVDGVGLQSHFVVGSTPSTATQTANLESFTAMGVEVAITELDIRMTLPNSTALLRQQATDYQSTVAACLGVKDCVGVTVWDFDDKYSWVPSTFPGTGDAVIFDEDLQRTPAYYGVVAALTKSSNSSSGASNGTSIAAALADSASTSTSTSSVMPTSYNAISSNSAPAITGPSSRHVFMAVYIVLLSSVALL